MLVLIVSAYDPRSGVVTAYRNIVEELNERGVRFDAYGFTGWRPDSPFRDFCDRLYGPEVTLTEVLAQNQWWQPMGRTGYDVVHAIDTAYEFPFSVDVWLRRARFRGGVILNCHSSQTQLSTPTRAHLGVGCSVEAAEAIAPFVSETTVVPNGIDTEAFDRRRVDYDGPPVLLWVGRSSTPEKNLPGFLTVADRLTGYRAIVVDADDNPALVAGHRVEYRSGLDRDQLAGLYNLTGASGGALVATSFYEGMSFVFLEAAACGCPVVAARVPGTAALEETGTGVLYELTDDMRGVDEVLSWLPQHRAALVDHARGVVRDRHSRSAMADGYWRAYLAALEKAPRRRSAVDRAVGRGWSLALAAQRDYRNLSS